MSALASECWSEAVELPDTATLLAMGIDKRKEPLAMLVRKSFAALSAAFCVASKRLEISAMLELRSSVISCACLFAASSVAWAIARSLLKLVSSCSYTETATTIQLRTQAPQK